MEYSETFFMRCNKNYSLGYAKRNQWLGKSKLGKKKRKKGGKGEENVRFLHKKKELHR